MKKDQMVEYLQRTVKNKKLSIAKKSIYNYVIEHQKRERNIQRSWNNPIFNNIYRSKILSVNSNLNENSYIHNTHLLKSIMNKDINPNDIGKLNVIRIHLSDNWKELA